MSGLTIPPPVDVTPLGGVARLRRGQVADCPAAARLASESFSSPFREAWSAVQMASVVAQPNGWLTLADVEDRAGQTMLMAGFTLCRHVVDSTELLLCATSPAHRRQGIGRFLLEAARLEARRRGSSRLFLEVRAENAAAVALYHSIGFVSIGRRPGYYRSASGQTADALTLGLDL